MKTFKYISALLIFTISAYFGYLAIGALTTMYLHFCLITAGCGILVLLDGGRKQNAKSGKKS